MTNPSPIPSEVSDFLRAAATASRESAAAGAAGAEALARLVTAAAGHDNSQAVVIKRFLASCYNGGDALRVRLDDIRRLDWSLQKDMVAVILGCGREGFPDTQIRQAMRDAGGELAVDELHWYTTGGAHRDALARLVEFISRNRACSSARDLLAALQSIVNGAPCNLSRLGFIDDEHTTDVCLVMSALYGEDQGVLHVEDIAAALDRAALR